MSEFNYSNRVQMDHLDETSDGSCVSGSLTGQLGLFVQALLAFIAFSALIVKRFCEPSSERRPWVIWFFDTSKQAIGATVIHFSNVFLSEIFRGDPCTWYVVSFLLDSTVGLLVICIGLKISMCIIKCKHWNTMTFGHYGEPPKCLAWLGQCLIYVIIVIVEKILMTLILLFDFWKRVPAFLRFFLTNPELRLVLVMFIIPLFVNALVFWVVDNYLKEKNWKQRDVRRNIFRAADSNVTPMKQRSQAVDAQGRKYKRVRWDDNGSYDAEERLLSMEDYDTGLDAVSLQMQPYTSSLSTSASIEFHGLPASSVTPGRRTVTDRLQFL